MSIRSVSDAIGRLEEFRTIREYSSSGLDSTGSLPGNESSFLKNSGEAFVRTWTDPAGYSGPACVADTAPATSQAWRRKRDSFNQALRVLRKLHILHNATTVKTGRKAFHWHVLGTR